MRGALSCCLALRLCGAAPAGWRPAPLAALRPAHGEAEEAALRAAGACFWDGDDVYTYARCCSCSDAGGGAEWCWQDGYTHGACCVFPFGHLAGDPRALMRHVPCRNESGTEFHSCTLGLGTFRPTVRQGLLRMGSRDIIVWATGFLLAKLLSAGWLPPASDRPLRVLEVCACIGLPALAAANLGHEVTVTDHDAQTIRLVRENAQRALPGAAVRVERLDLMDSNATAAFVRERGAHDVLLVGIEYLTPRMVRGIVELCDRSTRLLAAVRLSSLTNEAKIQRSMRHLQRHFETADSMDARAVEAARWLPSGFKMGAMELRPRRGRRKRTDGRL